MRSGLAEAEERVWLETYLADLTNNQRVLVYAYTSLERLVGQVENLPHDQPKKAWLLQRSEVSGLGCPRCSTPSTVNLCGGPALRRRLDTYVRETVQADWHAVW
jgi:hypothetical protein